MLISFIRTCLMFILLITAIRLMGKRQLGEMEPSEFVVSMLLAELASAPMQNLEIPLLCGVIPILTIMSMEILLSVLSYRFIAFRRLLCGKPVLVMEHGRMIPENLKKTRLTPDELVEHLREKDIFDLSVIRYAILETNGQISAMIDSQYKPAAAEDQKIAVKQHGLPITLVSSGEIVKQGLRPTKRGSRWIMELLKEKECPLQDVLLLTEDENGQIYLAQKGERV